MCLFKLNMKSFVRASSIKLTFSCVSAFVVFANIGTLMASEGESGEKALEPLAWQTDLAIWTAVVFGILLLILWRFAFGPILKALDLRERNEIDRLAAAEKNNSDAKELLEQYRQKLADSEEEVRKIMSDARIEAQRQAEGIIAEAKQTAADERARILQDIQIASDVALQELTVKSVQLATTLAGKILKEEVDPTKHNRLVQNAIDTIADK